MPNTCSVFGCKSNYRSTKEAVSVFQLPPEGDDPLIRLKWIQGIAREKYVPSKNTRVCIKHFDPKFIEYVAVPKNPGGKKRPKLSKGAYPTIFPNQPTYRTTKASKKRKSSVEREELVEKNRKIVTDQLVQKDKIEKLLDFENYRKHVKLNEMENRINQWMFFKQDDGVIFLKLDGSENVKVAVSVKIFEDFSVKIYHGINQLNSRLTNQLLNYKSTCDSWTTFKNLLDKLEKFDFKEESLETKLHQLHYLIGKISESIEANNDTEENIQRKLLFIKEQVQLTLLKVPRYSNETLIWSCLVYFTFPAAYKMIRELGLFTLPHPSYLKRLSSNVTSTDCSLSGDHEAYIIERAKLLPDSEKIVNVMLDEIYVKEGIYYKAGQLVGSAVNTDDDTARTVQVFMIHSYFSSNSEVVAMFPVKNLTADQLAQQTICVLASLKKCGYRVVSLSADNNRVNKNMYEILAKGDLSETISNPVDPENKLFLLFDTVHIFKNIRNNWFNQKLKQTFVYPIFQPLLDIHVEGDVENMYGIASVMHLKKIYDKEKGSVVKLANGLSRKSLFPSSFERQNVLPVVKLFQDKNIVALNQYMEKLGFPRMEVWGTSHFMKIIETWWKIVNVKSIGKGHHLRDPYQDPIKSMDDLKIEFLKSFVDWLDKWDALETPEKYKDMNQPTARVGKLTRETHFAITHTTKTLIALSQYFLTEIKSDCVMLGKCQSDKLEKRFGRYRTMNGRNYNITYRQILESEKKIRFLSYLKLKSEKDGNFEIKTLKIGDCDGSISVCQEIYERFSSIVGTSDSINIAEEYLPALIFIAGYSIKALLNSLECQSCKDYLCYNRTLEMEVPQEYSYMLLIDRGGLKVPKPFVVDLAVMTLKVFQCLVSKQYEYDFLKINCQRNLLIQLVINKFEGQLGHFDICNCGTCISYIVKECLSPLSNIFLNNYSKLKSDQVVENAALKKAASKEKKKKAEVRKLSTLNK